jgi:glycosyltransferase involved in cell wall biosynthesis
MTELNFSIRTLKWLATGVALVLSASAFAGGECDKRIVDKISGLTAQPVMSQQLRDLISPEARLGKTHMPDLTPAEEQGLIEQYKKDGRPILVFTDAHAGQKSGVVTMMKVMKDEVERLTDGKVTIKYITPDQFFFRLKVNYADLMFAWMRKKRFDQILKEVNPQAIHVMVEGSLGKQARKYLIQRGIPFTTAYHTMFPEYVRDMVAKGLKNISPGKMLLGGPLNLRAIPKPSQIGLLSKIPGYRPLTESFEGYIGSQWMKYAPYTDQYLSAPLEKFIQSYNDLNAKMVPKVDAAVKKLIPQSATDAWNKMADAAAEKVRQIVNADLRDFHGASEGIMVPTQSMVDRLNDGGYDGDRIRYWSHGTDTNLFKTAPKDPSVFAGLKGPIAFYAGRIAVEKGLTTALDALAGEKSDFHGTFVLVGDGPEFAALKKKYPKAVFLGRKNYEDLPKFYQNADVFVFPSRTDTFGLVQLEANACGTPTAALDNPGPADIYGVPTNGVPGHKAGALAQIASTEEQTQENFKQAVQKALTLSRDDVRKFAEEHTWRKSILEYLYFLRPVSQTRTAP